MNRFATALLVLALGAGCTTAAPTSGFVGFEQKFSGEIDERRELEAVLRAALHFAEQQGEPLVVVTLRGTPGFVSQAVAEVRELRNWEQMAGNQETPLRDRHALLEEVSIHGRDAKVRLWVGPVFAGAQLSCGTRYEISLRKEEEWVIFGPITLTLC